MNHSRTSPKYIPCSITTSNGKLLSRVEGNQTLNINYGNSYAEENRNIYGKQYYEYPLRDFDVRAVEQERDNSPTIPSSKSSTNDSKKISK